MPASVKINSGVREFELTLRIVSPSMIVMGWGEIGWHEDKNRNSESASQRMNFMQIIINQRLVLAVFILAVTFKTFRLIK